MKKFKQLLSLTLCAAALVSTVSGCTVPNSGKSATQTAGGSVKKISYSLEKECETLDPSLNNYSRSSIVLQNLFHGLYKYGPDGKTAPALAESYSVDKTGTVYTFKLRKNLKWSDGSALTAKDFEYAWKRVLDPKVASKGVSDLYYLKNGEAYNKGKAKAEDVGVKAVDDNTLLVTLQNPTAYFVDLTSATTYFPVKKDVVEASTPWTKSASTYVCDGPFMLKEIKPQEKYVLVKNPNYVDADKVKLDEVDISFIEAQEATMAAYTNNELDVADNLSAQSLQQYVGGKELKETNRIGTYYLDFNCSHKAFSDPRVRKALAMTIDRKTLIKNIMQSDEKPAYGFVPYGIPLATDTSKDYRQATGDLFTEDTAAAKKLLADAGYPDGKGFPTFTYITFNSASDIDIAQALQSMWKKNLGINMKITTYESKVYWDEQAKGNFDVSRDGWTGDFLDPMTNLELFTKVKTDDDCRWTGAQADQYDDLLKANQASADQKLRMDNFQKAEKILMDDMPIIPVYFMQSKYLVKPRVTGVTKNVIGHTLFEYASVTS